MQAAAADDFFLNAGGFVDPLVLDVQDGIDGMLALERSEAVLPPPSGETGAVAPHVDGLHIQFSRPPAGDAVFDLQPRCRVRGIAGFRESGRARGRDFEIARFFEIVVVRHEVRALLCERGALTGAQCSET